MRGLAALATAIGLVLTPALAGRAEAESAIPPGATTLMRYWTDNGTIFMSCTHPSCVQGSTVSVKQLDGRPVPTRADFHREQLQVAEAGANRIAARGGNLHLSAPSVRTSRGTTTMILRGHMQEPGEPKTFVTRGMIYCGPCAVSVVSTSTSKSRADAMFAYGYSLCPKNR